MKILSLCEGRFCYCSLNILFKFR